jgi:2-polyprenyl-3-methyl-5-hydroxy-6-metoxy-1,4-benzoquinol methylase
MVQAVWQELPGTVWPDKVRAFYERGEECVFDLLSRATTGAARLESLERDGLWSRIVAAGADALDFGGGLGQVSSLLCESHKRVTYVDVEGAIARYAAWSFDRAGEHAIEVRSAAADRTAMLGDRQFDVVLAENVLEHVGDAGATVEALARCVRAGGLLHISIDPRPASAAEPHRREIAVDDLLALSPALRSLEYLQRSDDGRHLFVSP